jgi:hypothetical protein
MSRSSVASLVRAAHGHREVRLLALITLLLSPLSSDGHVALRGEETSPPTEKKAPAPAPPAEKSEAGAKPAVEGIFSRIAVIGASVSAGFSYPPAKNVSAKLAEIIEKSLVVPHEPLLSAAYDVFFLHPEQCGTLALEKAREFQPTLVVALDYLFWYGYGHVEADSERLERLEKGLKNLESFQCPVLVGDFPDMSPALKARVKMISRDQVPSQPALRKLNDRVKEWAAERKNVILVPLAEVCRKVHANGKIEVRGNLYEEGKSQRLFQDDLLHTNIEGSALLWVMSVDLLVQAGQKIQDADVLLDAKAIRKKVIAGHS